MDISRNGVGSITDDDEEYVEDGIFDWRTNHAEIQDLLIETLKKIPEFYDTELFKRITSIHHGHEEIGFHCGREFRSNTKKVICPICGGTASLT